MNPKPMNQIDRLRRSERRFREMVAQQRFYDEEPMLGPPDCSEAAFEQPLLRRCPFDLTSFSWVAALDGGLDGFAWKVMAGGKGPFVIKVFWDSEPPESSWFLYYAAQREGLNAALLEKIAAAVSHDTETLPIRVHAQPSTHEDAMDNLLAFSDEGRQRRRVKDADAVTISSIPRMKKCFGWLKIDGRYLHELPRALRPVPVRLRTFGDREILPDREYFAIVYEYIPEGDSDPSQMQLVLDFLWRAGFEFTQSLRKENWKSGVLVDLSDFISPMGFFWHPNGYRRIDASRGFLGPPPPPPRPPPSRPSASHGSQSGSNTASSASPSPYPSSISSSDTEEGE